MTHALGIGFNPRYVSGELAIPADAVYLEAGASFLLEHASLGSPFGSIDKYSLHLARAPFCEALDVQRRFASELAARLPASVATIGLHLSGPYRKDLGHFGLGTAFEPTAEHEARARRLVDLLVDATGRRILLENANYYDRSVRTAARTLAIQNRLAAGLILDCSHLVMEAHNLGVSPDLLVGMIDLDKIEVVHVSGIVEGKDGAYHDGHQLPVHDRAWELLDRVLAVVDHPVTIVLEHSDPRWTDADPRFAADWERLRTVAAREITNAPAYAIDVDRVAIGYMANVVLPQRFPALVAKLGKPAFDAVVRRWGADYITRVPDGTVVLRADERALYAGELVDPVADFVRDLESRAC